VPSSLILASLKATRLLDNIFIFRELEKGLKKTPGGLIFSVNLGEIEKNKYSLVGCFFRISKRA
jgi:hypothetical protein